MSAALEASSVGKVSRIGGAIARAPVCMRVCMSRRKILCTPHCPRNGVTPTLLRLLLLLLLLSLHAPAAAPTRPPVFVHVVGFQLDVVWCLIQGYLFRGGAEGAADALQQLRKLLTKALLAAENR